MKRSIALALATLVVAAAVPAGVLAAVDRPAATDATGQTVDPDDSGNNATDGTLLGDLPALGYHFELAAILFSPPDPPSDTYRGTVRTVRYGGRCGGGEANGTEVTAIQYEAMALVLETDDQSYVLDSSALGEGGLEEGQRVTVTGHLESTDDEECPGPPADTVLVVEEYIVHEE